ncbi:hypothetical protein PSN45_003374 [Yamadazyma tenuis]|uniref:JAB1/MPN/MOV34 metalloenzyme domain-containing protein n=1 Tax=Candida tenuis (strain ATCC 10573 / BCRC 21748 / CBS 615 / JCM 9827 / NBRC 10315 / NRRL Y-1498 / VKM Y-70) TaxID=590646 RepID=G3AYD2_CANTC|nr:uncharacterized protein CANTEDRAFT_92162 [Yamadazyma tenuis ATCC 10573]EGV65824.1 hypothetical protein CANTEDRAFT_92162 [Yamadazyma tenuis ATCC 10573]WEJ95845.1 hypothetical protein PSN45_003374 [Yamadazyma tenuis]
MDYSTISVHSLALFNINTAISNNASVGVLLGVPGSDSVCVHTAFELLASNGTIDMDFYNQRLQQHLTVLPKLEKVGIYHILDKSTPTILTEQLCQEFNSSVCLVVNLNSVSDKTFIKGYHNGKPLNTIVESDETENISLSTIIRNSQYHLSNHRSDELDQVDLNQSKNNILNSIEQMSIKVQGIVDYCNSERPGLEVSKMIEINNLIGQLSRHVSYLRSTNHKEPEFNDKLASTELALLSTKLVSLDRLKSQLNSNTANICMKSKRMV